MYMKQPSYTCTYMNQTSLHSNICDNFQVASSNFSICSQFQNIKATKTIDKKHVNFDYISERLTQNHLIESLSDQYILKVYDLSSYCKSIYFRKQLFFFHICQAQENHENKLSRT